MEFPEDFNQLELLSTHGHLIPRGANSFWSGSTTKEDDEEEEEEEVHSEEWYQEKEENLKDKPEELILWAAENNRLSTVCRLLTADPLLVHCCDEDGYTPLHRAAYSGHVDVVFALITAGSKVNPRTIDGWTPLHSACRWSRVTVGGKRCDQTQRTDRRIVSTQHSDSETPHNQGQGRPDSAASDCSPQ
ncbi:ankyrin repeat domain-containing protein 49 isoform X2 [Echeneis naucrates]|uniref:ankyrin repeat domain-containing protein 49 isoform X2 n=1 Tax=Echeneis naucrates TaxID=173247 RepID=UPI001113DE0A|nr:ankyrin repeat domain-containing protein 49 isoform X2 [Echeneis naucrates]